jgi:DNA-directed RNA polymerase subunit RPC12/RpoP
MPAHDPFNFRCAICGDLFNDRDHINRDIGSVCEACDNECEPDEED